MECVEIGIGITVMAVTASISISPLKEEKKATGKDLIDGSTHRQGFREI